MLDRVLNTSLECILENCVPCVLTYSAYLVPYVFSCLKCFVSYVLLYLTWLAPFVCSCLACFLLQVLSSFIYPVPYVPLFLT